MIEVVLFAAIIIGYIFHTTIKPRNFPPGPFALPLIGNFLSLNYGNPQSGWNVLSKRYGDIVGLQLPFIKLAIISGYDTVKEALLNEGLSGRPSVCLINDMSEDGKKYGLVFTDGPSWRKQKRFTMHHLRNLGIGRKSHERIIHEEIESVVSELEDLKGTPTFMQHRLARSTINILWGMVGGKRFNRSDPQLHELEKAISELFQHFSVIGGPVVVFPFLKYIFPAQTGYTTFNKNMKIIRKFLNATIEDHLNENLEKEESNNFISIYLREMKTFSTDQSFSIPQLHGIIRDLLLAGTDTTTNSICFALFFLCLYPEKQEKIYKEVLDVVGTHRLPSTDDRKDLIYVCAFINEVLRFRPVLPTLVPHRAMTDVKIKEYVIPNNTVVMMNFDSVMMDKEYWGDPEIFHPERFISEEGKLTKEERLTNFGKGNRVCVGETLGRTSMFLTVTSLAQKFCLHFPEGERPESTEGIPGFTNSAPEFRVIFTPRTT